MIRQFELVERVQSYDPEADEDCSTAPMSSRMKAHGTQMRASGDPYFSHPARGRRHPDRAASSTRASIVTGAAARHGRGHRRHARRDRRPVRREDRPPGRRRHQAQPARGAVGEHQAGRELPQAGAGHVGRHPRAAGEARRPAAQHAHAAAHQEPGQAPAHRARDDGDLCAAGRAHRHAERQATSSRTWPSPSSIPTAAPSCWRAWSSCASSGERLVPEHRAPS